LNLKEIRSHEKNKVGYGINYENKEHPNILYFYGTPQKNFPGKTLVIQIINKKRKILRELWLYGFDNQIKTKKANSLND